jgi:hypothetical protein|tara:strand:- start:3799 stop:5475 length:1677 start_codon:yes stop_codon:yes gene_type:complete
MSNLSDILKEEYFKQVNKFDLSTLMEMVEEAFDAVTNEDIEAPPGIPDNDEDALEMILKMIPNIEVSEIGWSDVRTTDEGVEIKGAQRTLLEDYLKNIEGSDFAGKIKSISEFYDNGVNMVVEQAGENRTGRIVQAISYLVFYKTLTKVITNFNASSAGFSFESFLAALVDGEQIPTGNKTIADYLDRSSGQTIPVSLKLYKEGNLEVGGSYTDLINDMVDPKYPQAINGGMRYVVCTKTLQGEGLDLEGKIDFYQFDFNLANVVDILLNSKYPYVIRIPTVVMSALAAGQQVGTAELLGLPAAGKARSAEELTPIFNKALYNQIEALADENPESLINRIDSEALGKLLKALNWEKNDDLFNGSKTRGKVTMNKAAVKNWTRTNYKSIPEVQVPLIKAIISANADVVKSQTRATQKSDRNQQIDDMVKGDEFLSAEESARQYNMLGASQKKQALLNSYGYLKTMHFAMNQTQSTNNSAPTNTEFVGSIMIGRSQVGKVISDIREILNDEVTGIFQALKILSDSLNQFFAGGLENDSLADTSVSSATSIGSKEILQTDK